MTLCLCLSVVGTTISSTSNASNIPAVSKSLIDIFLRGLVLDMSSACIPAGHLMRHTFDWMVDTRDVQTPPTAVPDASTYPI